jgi:predicted RNA-binding protein with RPS1 domain
VEESGCEINIEDDGTVNIFSVSEDGMKIAREAISGMTAEAEIGKIYRGKVVTIKDFGAFVEFLPGKDGLVHISELANFRVKQTEDIVKMGDEIWVKCLGVDEKGRVRLSRKAAMADRDQEMSGGAPAGGQSESGGAAPEMGMGGESRGPREPREQRSGDRGGEGGRGGDRGGERGGGGRDRDRGGRSEYRGGDRGGDRGGNRGGDRGGEQRRLPERESSRGGERTGGERPSGGERTGGERSSGGERQTGDQGSRSEGSSRGEYSDQERETPPRDY